MFNPSPNWPSEKLTTKNATEGESIPIVDIGLGRNDILLRQLASRAIEEDTSTCFDTSNVIGCMYDVRRLPLLFDNYDDDEG